MLFEADIERHDFRVIRQIRIEGNIVDRELTSKRIRSTILERDVKSGMCLAAARCDRQ